jgi:thiol-disulfide isomerase/thioredoxin
MNRRSLLSLSAAVVIIIAALHAQTATPPPSPAEAAIIANIKTLRDTPDGERGAKTRDIALEIRKLPAGPHKTSLAYGLATRATEGDFGHDNLQAVTTTLAQSLNETPATSKNDQPAAPYMEVAELVRYEGMTASLDAPQFKQALDILAAHDAEVEHLDFKLTDLRGKKWTLSKLRGKIIVVNFWATWCPPCRKEMPDLDELQKKYAKQGLVVLSISDEDMAKVAHYIDTVHYGPTVLLDPGDVVEKQFHIEGIPHSFVFNREGKLAAQAIDMRTHGQFIAMLTKAGIQP